MARKQDAAPLVLQIDQDVLEHVGVEWIESRKRLIHDEQLRLVQYRRDELDLLLHPLGQRLDLLSDPFVRVETLSPLMRSCRRVACGELFELAEEDEIFHRRHSSIQAALLWQIADLAQMVAIERLSEHRDGSRVGERAPDHHPDGARL